MKLFLDTNILIDYFAKRSPYYEDALRLSAAQIMGDVELWASTQSFSDVEYVLHKAIPLPDLRSAFKKSLGFLNILGTAPADLSEGIGNEWPELEDCYIACAAERLHADFIITRDRNGFMQSKIPALSPREWLDRMEGAGIVYDVIDF